MGITLMLVLSACGGQPAATGATSYIATLAGAPAGLYRGAGQIDGQNVIVGAVISADGSFASTTQYEGQIKFVTPVGPEPVQLSDNTLGITLGASGEQFTATLVTTLKGQ